MDILNSLDIQKLIPHRYPFLLVDKIIELEAGKRAVGIKNVSFNEPFFQGHFPGNPVMPGVLITEALAQTAGIAAASLEENKGKIGLFTGIEAMKFRRQVIPGDILRLETEIILMKRNIVKVKVTASVDGAVAANGIIKFIMISV